VAISIDVLCRGFPGKGSNGFLGWSSVALIRTASNNILFDTGAQAALPVLLNALKGLSLSPADIDTVVLSHSHFDHIANVRKFKQARFIMSRAEWDYATGQDEDICVEVGAVEYLKSQQLELLGTDGVEIVPNVTAIFTPGHTPGCLSLVIEQDGESWVLAGDAIKNRAELASGVGDMTLNAAVTKESIDRVKSIAARVLPGHDCWLRVTEAGVIAEEPATVRVTLPAGMSGVFDLSVDSGLFAPETKS
jgi:N-acyl homoserine lactone hydrolase